MTAAPSPDAHDDRLDLLDALVYGDAFDCAASLDELWRFARTPIERDALRLRLRDDPVLARAVIEREGFYAFADRPELLATRPARLSRARFLERRARRVARLLRHVPFVRGLALTGSVAAGDAGPDADVDLLAIVAPGRLATVFILLGPLSRLVGRRVFCPNYYVSEDGLELEPDTIYVARELAQTTALAGSCSALAARNPWLADVFPNFETPRSDARRSRLQRLLEAPLRGSVGGRLERWAGRVAADRLRAHYRVAGEQVADDVATSFAAGAALRFHGLYPRQRALDAYAARRAEIALRLMRLERGLEG